MVFNSLDFILFFIVVYLLYLRLSHRGQNLLLLLASYFFYGWWDWRFLSLLLFSTLLDYYCGLGIAASGTSVRRKLLLWLSVGGNLGMLGVFKYYDFFTASLTSGLARLGLELNPVTLNIILPVGIFFYTFQTMSYTIDIYRGHLKPTRRFGDLALFVAFFPQLVAGPIERASRLLPRIQHPRTLTATGITEGLYLIAWGMFKKVVIADSVARIANDVFGNWQNADAVMIMLGVYAFFIQLYCDFSGYSNIARGLAKMMGFELMVNFRQPYFAVNPTVFWQRWHISLSTWVRDYVFVPLGANRHGTVRTVFNIILTMTLMGLWHGANWTFVVWGFYMGCLQALHVLYRPFSRRYLQPSSQVGKTIWRWVCTVCTCNILVFSMLFFRAESLGQSWGMIRRLLTLPSSLAGPHLALIVSLLLAVIPLAVMAVAQYRSGNEQIYLRQGSLLRLAGGLAVFYMVFYLYFLGSGIHAGEEFIYFQF